MTSFTWKQAMLQRTVCYGASLLPTQMSQPSVLQAPIPKPGGHLVAGKSACLSDSKDSLITPTQNTMYR